MHMYLYKDTTHLNKVTEFCDNRSVLKMTSQEILRNGLDS